MSAPPVNLPLTEQQRARLKRLGIPDERLLKLRELWQREKLPDAAWSILVGYVADLANFYHFDRKRLMPMSDQFKRLEAVASAAGALEIALEHVGDFAIEFDGYLSEHDVPPADDVDEMFARIVHVLRITRATATAALATSSGLEAAGVKRMGRTLVLHRYANFLSGMAGQLAQFGVRLSAAGPMRRLGDAVFDAAGMPSTSEGALRLLTERQGARHWKDGAFKPPR